MTIRRALALASALVIAGVLAGCATPSGSASGTASGARTSGATDEVGAAWLDAGRLIAVVTYGTPCAPIAGAVEAKGQSITVELDEPSGDVACDASRAARVTLVAPPEGIDTSEDVTITTTGAVSGSTVLPGGAFTGTIGEATDYMPSAGWFSPEGFVVLTWGSSSCAPTVADVAAVADDTLRLTFADAPVDQACTMDMGPRLAVASVPSGFAGSGEVVLQITGDSTDASTPILGRR